MPPIVAPRFAGIRQFELCLDGARMTPDGLDADGNLTVDEANDPEAVAAVQDALHDLQYPQLVTLTYDATTANNVRQFKIDQNLPVPSGLTQHDGVCGPGTSGRLNALFTPPPIPTPPPTPVPPPPALDSWRKLISFRPPEAIQNTVDGRFGAPSRVVHAIEDARGPINLDYYPVRVFGLPTNPTHTTTAEELQEFIRRNINFFVDGAPDGCNFHPYEPLVDTAAWAPIFLPTGFVGAVISIDMFSNFVNVDDGSVVLSEIDSSHWVFSTLRTPNDLNHPVSGNREFGFFASAAGEFTFYTRGVDRCTSSLDVTMQSIVFGAAHKLWLSFQRRLADYVNGNGGHAAVDIPTSDRYDWPTVQTTYHHPTLAWVH